MHIIPWEQLCVLPVKKIIIIRETSATHVHFGTEWVGCAHKSPSGKEQEGDKKPALTLCWEGIWMATFPLALWLLQGSGGALLTSPLPHRALRNEVGISAGFGGILWFPCQMLSVGVTGMRKCGVAVVEGCRMLRCEYKGKQEREG